MLVAGFATGAFRVNCYLLAAARDRPCVIVDPGQEAAGSVEDALREHGLTPETVLATHGHPDHVACAGALARAHGVPFRLHPADHALAGTPAEPLGPGVIEVAGLRITVDHVPGHTAGSVVFRLQTPEGGRLALTGDTLFAGSIGRGDRETLVESLRDKLLTLPDDTVVLPGHGGPTTIGRERVSNPFLGGAAVPR
ncbi:MBL fold metallo-hydrolase [Amycolatopsis rhizosphaerae]|uniref:MBL fold metallo-hydrolase n=1 Tax=Amycolatopsis rhizosphaerae TaxID=2053003 RepID=A0A558CEG1_9PSEU|nr:MBL fold metallo-hydrolase [Amycolatopsis rhizosphaerae]TVT47137.1 MBL fold metallo-hydrolase [Amycolatopsis rhizosphaerae]